MIRQPPGSTLTHTHFHYTPLSRSDTARRRYRCAPAARPQPSACAASSTGPPPPCRPPPARAARSAPRGRHRRRHTAYPRRRTHSRRSGRRSPPDRRSCRSFLPLELGHLGPASGLGRSEAHTSELQSLMRISYAVFFLKKKNYILSTYHLH